MPAIGEAIVVYERLSFAVSTLAFAAASAAAVDCSVPLASSRSFCDKGVLRSQRFDPVQGGDGRVVRGLGLFPSRLRLAQRGDERFLVHHEQYLACLDDFAFRVELLVEETVDPRHDADLLRALRLRDVFVNHRRIEPARS